MRAFGGRFARADQPWIATEPEEHVWLDCDRLSEQLAVLSGGERRVLGVVVALVDPTPDRLIDLADLAAGVDRDHLDPVLAALAHAGGSHEHALLVGDIENSTAHVERPGSLHHCPGEQPDSTSRVHNREALPAPGREALGR
ncbi:hypothetical protein [Cellulomonas dongxiuzhuiae]|uniref:hypothetical protein n=1 Tax=Cellulomonas dongxiuzhuiae TaxID=2819979 RepID=UPI001AAF6B63|nr:hypothetical protein [Cellulomonas dongxiuzhuiae]MBO3087112.1 hypothetical protein [Cellulomonas dongxiuzhuiae]